MSETCVTYNFPNAVPDLVTSSEKYQHSKKATMDQPGTSFTKEIDGDGDDDRNIFL